MSERSVLDVLRAVDIIKTSLPLPIAEEVLEQIQIPDLPFPLSCYDEYGMLKSATTTRECWCGLTKTPHIVDRFGKCYVIISEIGPCTNPDCLTYLFKETNRYTLTVNDYLISYSSSSTIQSDGLTSNLVSPGITQMLALSPFNYLDLKYYQAN